jgi:hypothetical protein
MIRRALSLVLLIACGSHAPASSDQEIQDGKRTTAYPAVGVVHQKNVNSFCTGTLIAPDIVLTAGHCIEDDTADAFFTGDGKASTDDGTDPASLGMVRHEVLDQARFPSFDYFYSCPNPELDVALLRLKTPITDIEPLDVGAPPAAGTTCTTVGFGMHDTDAGTEFLEKREAKVKLLELRDVSLDITAVDGISSHGDSGGPLFCGSTIVATTSCQPDYPPDAITYGNLAAGLTWINEMRAHWVAP